MLSSIKFVDQSSAQQALTEDLKARKKERKRQKKERRKQKGKGKASGSSGSESDGPDGQQQAAAHAQQAADPLGASLALQGAASPAAREDWMTKSFAKPKAPDSAAAAAGAAEEAKQAKKKPRELGASTESAIQDVLGASANAAKVGDGGASWRLKALQRARQQIADPEDPRYGKRLQEVVGQHWGSLDKLTAGLTDTRAAHARAHIHAAKDRRPADDDAKGAAGPGPAGRDGAGADGQRQNAVGSRKRDGGQGRGSGSSRGGDSSKTEGRPPRSGYLDEVKSGKAQMRRPSGHSSVSWRRPERGASGASADSRPPHSRGPRPGSHQAELLASVATEINQFANDGSFMEQFKAGQPASQEAADRPAREAAAADEGPGAAVPAQEHHDAVIGRTDSHSLHVDGDPPGPASGIEVSGAGGNRSTAAALRARLQGGGSNAGTAAMLRAQLQGKAGGQAAAAAAAGTRRETVVLSGVDAEGRAQPGAFGRAAAGEGPPEASRRAKQTQRFESGERQRYFADDDRLTLSDLVKEQRYGGAADVDANLADSIMRKGKRFRERELDADEEYDVDGGLDMSEARTKKGTQEQQRKRQRSQQVADHRRTVGAQDRCQLCFGSAARPRHLTISIGQTAYLALPDKGRLVPGHCLIVPAEHCPSSRQADEHVWTEMRNFKKCLLQMFMAQGQDVLFMETSMHLKDPRTHAAVECLPVPPSVASRAPIYFRKGLDDAESEWSQHHAKRMIDTGTKGLRGSIPAGFPYFHVELNLVKGFVHVIDDEAKFDPEFGRKILIGLLELPEEQMHRRQRVDGKQVQEQWVADFAKQWEEFDWTKQLA